MIPWSFFDFIRENGENPFGAWYAQQEPGVRSALDLTVYSRRVTDDWLYPPTKSAKKQFKEFTAKEKGLAELRFWTDDRKFRAIGIYRPIQREFILLVGCEEKFMGYLPRNAMASAMKYKTEFETATGTTRART